MRVWCVADGRRSRSPEGWTQLIRGGRPPSVKWPVTEKDGDGKRNFSAASSSQKKAPSQSKPAPKGPVEGGPFPSGIAAGVGTGGIRCQNSFGGGDQFSEGRASETGPPSTESCRCCSTCWSPRSGCATSWRRRSRCRASESGPEATKDACTSASRWRASRCVPPAIWRPCAQRLQHSHDLAQSPAQNEG